jgi:energy-coupling factor transporter ATP-binding protein EcfA2
MMQIGEFRHVVAKKLSGGTKRKLSLAIALVAGPRVVFLDEPSAGVDVSAKRFLWNVIRANASHQAIVLTTHSLEEAEALSDRVMIMVNGGVAVHWLAGASAAALWPRPAGGGEERGGDGGGGGGGGGGAVWRVRAGVVVFRRAALPRARRSGAGSCV